MHFCSPLCEPATMAAMAHHTRHRQVGREGFPVLVFASLIHRPQGWPREAHSHPTLTLQVHSPVSLKTCQSSLLCPSLFPRQNGGCFLPPGILDLWTDVQRGHLQRALPGAQCLVGRRKRCSEFQKSTGNESIRNYYFWKQFDILWKELGRLSLEKADHCQGSVVLVISPYRPGTQGGFIQSFKHIEPLNISLWSCPFRLLKGLLVAKALIEWVGTSSGLARGSL